MKIKQMGIQIYFESYSVMAVEKIKILGAVLELPAKQRCQFSQFTVKMGQMGWIGSAINPNWHDLKSYTKA